MNNTNLENLLNNSLYVHKELECNDRDSALYRWLNKKVYNSILLYDGSSLDNIIPNSDAPVSISNDIKLNGSSLKISLSTDIEGKERRPWPSVKLNLNNCSLVEFNRIKLNVYISAIGYQGFYTQFSIDSIFTHSQYVETNKWIEVIFELSSDFDKSCCKNLVIQPWLMGKAPEALEKYEFYVDSIYAEKVDADFVDGWTLDDRIAYCHAGYFIDAKKVALTGKAVSQEFFIYNKDNKIIYSNNVNKKETSYGLFYELDFSDLKEEGQYYLSIDERKTPLFLISNTAYDETIWKSMNFLRLLRCGEDIPGVHSACHLNCKTVHPNGKMVPNFGGWHDAGDVSQFEIPTAEMAHSIIDLALTVKNSNPLMYERLKEEARVGLNWLLRTRFGDGYRACAVTYSICRNNILDPENKTIYNNVAENGPFENFCSAAALAKAYVLYVDEDKVFAEWCLRSAIEDFEFASIGYDNGIYTKRWGPNVDSQVCGHGIIAAVELYNITKEEKYKNIAVRYADIVLSCQQSDDPNWDIPLKGFFYEDPNHEWILTYEHRGHEQSPVQGLVMIAWTFNDHPNYSKWVKGINLYKEYVLKSMELTSIYNVLPGHVYILDKLNSTRFTIPSSYGTIPEGMEILRNQAKSGIKLNDNVYLRIFPIAVQRKGYFATLLSKTKGVSMIARFLKDDNLMNICIKQLEWILGANPFASSTMYGFGYNYHPLYVAFSRQMVGALPVGIMTNGNKDEPFWPVRDNAVFKEIWGHTTGKYLWVLSDIILRSYEK